MADVPVVVMSAPVANDFAMSAMLGVRRYVEECVDWDLRRMHHRREELISELGRLSPGASGLVGYFHKVEEERRLERFHIPVVNVSARSRRSRVYRVLAEGRAAGRMAARHLMDRGHDNFAFVGYDTLFSDERRSGFVEEVRSAGGMVRRRLWSSEDDIRRWLPTVRPGTGVLACNDHLADQLLRLCTELGITVPDDMALISIGNEEKTCELADVPITSVDVDAQRVGFEAAALLDRLIQGKKVFRKPVLVRPLRVVERTSTRAYRASDPVFGQALRFIGTNACLGADVDAVAEHVGTSRRTLEALFQKKLGRSPYQEILRVRFERVVDLLASTDRKLEDVARRCGFARVNHFSAAFRKRFGRPPGAYRRQRRAVGPAR